MVGQTVTLQGIVTANFQAANSLGGFYLRKKTPTLSMPTRQPPKASSSFTRRRLLPWATKVNVTGTVAELGIAGPMR